MNFDLKDIKDWIILIFGSTTIGVIIKAWIDKRKDKSDIGESEARTSESEARTLKTEAEANKINAEATTLQIDATMKVLKQLEDRNMRMETENNLLTQRVEELVKQLNGIKDDLAAKNRQIEEQAHLITQLRDEIKKLKAK